MDESIVSSLWDSTVTKGVSSAAASASSAAVLPMPENIILSGAMPAARALELAFRHDVGAGAETGERLDHRLVGIRLHGVADQRLHVGKGVREHVVMPAERGGRVAIKWGRDRLREINEIDRLGVKDAVAIGEMVHSAGSVEQPIDERAAFGSLRCRDDLAVGPDGRLEVRSRKAGVGGRRSRRRVEPGFASATGKAQRGDKRADSCDPGKAQAGRRTQFGPSSIGSTISDRTEEATAWRNNPVPMRSEEFISAPFPRP